MYIDSNNTVMLIPRVKQWIHFVLDKEEQNFLTIILIKKSSF